MRPSRRPFRLVTILLPLALMLSGLAVYPSSAQTNCPAQYVGVSIALAIDISQSMNEPASANRTKLDAAKAAASEFVGTVTGGADQLAIVSFAGTSQASPIFPLTTTNSGDQRAAATAAIGQLQIVSSGEGTDISQGVSVAARALADARTGTNRVIILLTDGAANQPGGYDTAPQYAISAAQEAAGANIAIYTIGLRLGDQAGSNPQLARDLLTRIAEIGRGTFYDAPTGTELSQIYQAISTRITACVAPTPAPMPKTGVVGAPVMFPETGYSLEGEFLSYWRVNGDLAVFGYPIDSQRQVSGKVNQWLERARFELHPENAAPYNVQLSRLGIDSLAQEGRDWQSFAKADPGTAHYFKETGHAIAPQFWEYWRTHGLNFDGHHGTSFAESLALFGYPISEPQMETNVSGDRVLTQWFERARFEYHPDKPTAYQVLLGRLGAEMHAAAQP